MLELMPKQQKTHKLIESYVIKVKCFICYIRINVSTHNPKL